MQRPNGLALGFVDECQAATLDLEDGAVLLKPVAHLNARSSNRIHTQFQAGTEVIAAICM